MEGKAGGAWGANWSRECLSDAERYDIPFKWEICNHPLTILQSKVTSQTRLVSVHIAKFHFSVCNISQQPPLTSHTSKCWRDCMGLQVCESTFITLKPPSPFLYPLSPLV